MQPLVAATVLTVGVRVLVAAGRLEVATRVEESLAPLREILGRSMSAKDHEAYLAAVRVLDAVSPGGAVGAAPLSQPEAFVLAQRELLHLAAALAAHHTTAAPTG